MRLLVYGMQSSGATAFTLFLAQRPDCLAMVDMLNNFAAPRVKTDKDMVAKVTMTTAYPLAVHMERFRPDRTILLLRNPLDNYWSLSRKNHRNHSGLLDEKFLLLDRTFAERDSFDGVVFYEDFVARDPSVIAMLNRLGWPVDETCYEYRRGHEELLNALWREMPDLWDRMEFSFGCVRGARVDETFRDKPRDPDIEARVRDLCPRLSAFYRRQRGRLRGCAGGAPGDDAATRRVDVDLDDGSN